MVQEEEWHFVSYCVHLRSKMFKTQEYKIQCRGYLLTFIFSRALKNGWKLHTAVDNCILDNNIGWIEALSLDTYSCMLHTHWLCLMKICRRKPLCLVLQSKMVQICSVFVVTKKQEGKYTPTKFLFHLCIQQTFSFLGCGCSFLTMMV